MKTFFAFVQYRSYLRKLEKQLDPGILSSTESLKQWIERDRSPIFKTLESAFAQLPGVESEWSIMNFPALVRGWAKENGFTPDPDPKKEFLSILMEQLRRFKPDVLLLLLFGDEWYFFETDFVEEVRRQVPSLRLIIGWDGRNHLRADYCRKLDFILVGIPNLVGTYAKLGIEAIDFPYFFDPTLLEEFGDLPREHSLVFSGTIQVARTGAHRRFDLCYRLLDFPEFELFHETSFFKNWRSWAGILRRRQWKYLYRFLRLEQRNQGALFGLDLYRLFATSNIAINIHADNAGAAGNARCFEIMGAGACHLVDDQPNLPTLFDPDSEVVRVRSMDEAVEKCRWLLDHPEQAREIGLRGQQRVLRDHTTTKRAEFLLELIKERL